MLKPIVSQVFCCNTCSAPVALLITVGDELVYECQNSRCGRAISVDCPEGLALLEDLTIELAAPRILSDMHTAIELSADATVAQLRKTWRGRQATKRTPLAKVA